MKNELTRRNLLGRAGIALGGAVALGALACGSDDSDPQPEPQPQEGPRSRTFPTEAPRRRLPAERRRGEGGRVPGLLRRRLLPRRFSALLGDLNRAGAPFTLLPLGFGKFGAGGVELYGSICGAALGGVLVLNMVVENPDHRRALVTELLRWYEGAAFPAYVPQALVAAETADATKPTLDFSAGNVVNLQVVPGSHLCRLSLHLVRRDGGVNAGGADKKARCAAGNGRRRQDRRVVNAYLVSGAYGARRLRRGDRLGLRHLSRLPRHEGEHAPGRGDRDELTTCHPDQVSPTSAVAGPRSSHAGGAPRGMRPASHRAAAAAISVALTAAAPWRGAPLRAPAAGATRFAAPARGGCGAVADVRGADEPLLLLVVEPDRVAQDLQRLGAALRLGDEHLLVLERLVVLEEPLQLAHPVARDLRDVGVVRRRSGRPRARR